MTSRKSERRTRLKRRRDALMERLDIDNAELESVIDEIAGKYSEPVRASPRVYGGPFNFGFLDMAHPALSL